MSIGTTSAKTTRIAVIGASCILALLMELSFAQCIRAQDIPLDSCKALATIEATADRRRLRFLVDTGATSSLLNAKSFSEGDAAHVMVHSWNGAFSADGRGLGLEIDLKRHVARFAADAKHEEKEFTDLGEQLELCRAAFDRSDMKAIGNCLDPDVVLVDSGKSYRGRDAVLKYFDHEYFADGRSTTMSIDRSTYHATGEGVWLEYELRIRFHDQAIRERGTALFQKLGRKWLVVSLNGADPREELTPR
jgi:ketosteroid isomerase-like protein